MRNKVKQLRREEMGYIFHELSWIAAIPQQAVKFGDTLRSSYSKQAFGSREIKTDQPTIPRAMAAQILASAIQKAGRY